MLKVARIVLILAVAAVAIAATTYIASDKQHAAAPAASVAPMDMMRNAKPLPPTQVDSYY